MGSHCKACLESTFSTSRKNKPPSAEARPSSRAWGLPHSNPHSSPPLGLREPHLGNTPAICPPLHPPGLTQPQALREAGRHGAAWGSPGAPTPEPSRQKETA